MRISSIQLLHLFLFYICVAAGDIVGSSFFNILSVLFFYERLAYDFMSLCLSVQQHAYFL